MWIFNKHKRGSKDKYKKLSFQNSEIKNEDYKNFIGGQHPEKWDRRGEFQLYFLKKMGLAPENKLLDIGCGPLRAGRYLIEFLNQENYIGFDYNESFISIAKDIVRKKDSLSSKKPSVSCVDNFVINKIDGGFDVAIAFSVFNHCSKDQKAQFFNSFRGNLAPFGKLYITHAKWLKRKKLQPLNFRINKIFEQSQDVDPNLSMQAYGWPAGKCSVFPIVELQEIR